MTHDFLSYLAASRGRRSHSVEATIRQMLTCCVSVRPNELVEIDLLGVDYIATMSDGALISIDDKRGCVGRRRYWLNSMVPEMPMETWSVYPTKIGWTLDTKSITDYVLFSWEESPDVYLLPFQLLRTAFDRNKAAWIAAYGEKPQNSHKNGRAWQSRCVFVPAPVVHRAVFGAARAVGVSLAA